MLRTTLRRKPAIIAVALILLMVACAKAVTVERITVPGSSVATLDKRSPWLKAHLRDGSVYVLQKWQSDSNGRLIVGTGDHQDVNRVLIASGTFRVRTDSVALFETNVVKPSGANTALIVMSGITLAIAAACAANPKACFGSCPTFYLSDGTSDHLMAEGFSASVAPALEATDLDALWSARPSSRDVIVTMKNEAFETHVLRRIDLIAVPRAPGSRIVVDSHGAFFSATNLAAPTSCAALMGDCLRAVVKYDGGMYSSPTDSTDLGARESIDLEFPSHGTADIGIVISSRQTLLSTYLFYQALAWMGSNATPWLAQLPDHPTGPAAEGMTGVLGKLQVEVQNALGDWEVVGQVGETGPLATDTKLVQLPARLQANAPVRLRLRGTRGLWRIEQVALARIAPAAPAIKLTADSVIHQGKTDSVARASLVDTARVLTTLPGDEYRMHYRLPGKPADYELFLSARGYYLEWMREEWLAEENPWKAAQLFFDPKGALKALAPAYKKQEARMDSLFWGSRYVKN